MNRELMRRLVDICYQEFMEQPGAVPSTQWADQLINKACKQTIDRAAQRVIEAGARQAAGCPQCGRHLNPCPCCGPLDPIKAAHPVFIKVPYGQGPDVDECRLCKGHNLTPSGKVEHTADCPAKDAQP